MGHVTQTTPLGVNILFTDKVLGQFFIHLIVTALLNVQKDCPSGHLTKRKFLTIYKNMFPESRAVAFYEHVFRTLDQDGSGTIDFSEFLQVNIPLFIRIFVAIDSSTFN